MTNQGQHDVDGFGADALDIAAIRSQFPALNQQVHGQPLVYLDSAATSQTPSSVIAAVDAFYQRDCANVHRGLHALSERATRAYEATREKVQGFINAKLSQEVLFTRGTTEGINLVAQTYGVANVGPGDEIIVSEMEHHSNIVPWQMLCERQQATLRVIPVDDTGALVMDAFRKLLSKKTKIVAVAHTSNALGTNNPIEEIIGAAHDSGAVVVVDGAQAAPHRALDVVALDCDFYAFSGHKMYGPTGVGVLYGKAQHLEAMPPFLGGGDMIDRVTFEKTTWNELPYKFEAGTPNIAGVIGLGKAVEFMEAVGRTRIEAYEATLERYMSQRLKEITGLKLIGTASDKAAVCSFVIDGMHPQDVGTLLDEQGIAIRAGHHCAQPLMDRFGVSATARASLACYNTREEVDALVAGLEKVIAVFGLS